MAQAMPNGRRDRRDTKRSDNRHTHQAAVSALPVRILKPQRKADQGSVPELPPNGKESQGHADAIESRMALTDSSSTASAHDQQHSHNSRAKGGLRIKGASKGVVRTSDDATRQPSRAATETSRLTRHEHKIGSKQTDQARYGTKEVPQGISILTRPARVDADIQNSGEGSRHGAHDNSVLHARSAVRASGSERNDAQSAREGFAYDRHAQPHSDARRQAPDRGLQSTSGRLFDPRRDDPVRFQITTRSRPTMSSADKAYSPSLSMQSDNRSALTTNRPDVKPSTGPRNAVPGRHQEDAKYNGRRGNTRGTLSSSGIAHNSYMFEVQQRYRDITTLEQQARESSHVFTRSASSESDALEQTYDDITESFWQAQVARHKQLAEAHLLFLEAALRPGTPASLQKLPRLYNIASRLWQGAFQDLIDKLGMRAGQDFLRSREVSEKRRRTAAVAQDVLIDFIYFAYTFYSNLQESELFKDLRKHWTESLGDLASYRASLAQCAAISMSDDDGHSDDGAVQNEGELRQARKLPLSAITDNSNTPGPASPAPQEFDLDSAGSVTLRDWDLEEVEIWKNTAERWYARALCAAPGNGRVYHRLALLHRGVDGFRSLYFFYKSATVSRPLSIDRESMRTLFSQTRQDTRASGDALLLDSFVLLHGMLFAGVDVNDFIPALQDFKARLVSALASEADLPSNVAILMAIINTAAVITLGESSQRTGGKSGEEAKRAKQTMQPRQHREGSLTSSDDSASDDVDDSGKADISQAAAQKLTAQQDETANTNSNWRLSMRVALETLTTMVKCAPASQLGTSAASAYVTTWLMFLAHQSHNGGLAGCEDLVPWPQLVDLCNAAPPSSRYLDLPDLSVLHRIDAQDEHLPEDYCLRGMAWIGRHVYARDFWSEQGPEGLSPTVSELDVLAPQTKLSERGAALPVTPNLSQARWNRIVFALLTVAKHVPGLDCHTKTTETGTARLWLSLTSPLLGKLKTWKALHEQDDGVSQMQNLDIESEMQIQDPYDVASKDLP